MLGMMMIEAHSQYALGGPLEMLATFSDGEAGCTNEVSNWFRENFDFNQNAHSPTVGEWLRYFDGCHRYSHITTNLAEAINSSLKGTRHLPITSVVKTNYYRLVNLFANLIKEAMDWIASGHIFHPELQQKFQTFTAHENAIEPLTNQRHQVRSGQLKGVNPLNLPRSYIQPMNYVAREEDTPWPKAKQPIERVPMIQKLGPLSGLNMTKRAADSNSGRRKTSGKMSSKKSTVNSGQSQRSGSNPIRVWTVQYKSDLVHKGIQSGSLGLVHGTLRRQQRQNKARLNTAAAATATTEARFRITNGHNISKTRSVTTTLTHNTIRTPKQWRQAAALKVVAWFDLPGAKELTGG
ncbi:hypothetical protein GQ457_06G014760 [Hibiscus cannabinus]